MEFPGWFGGSKSRSIPAREDRSWSYFKHVDQNLFRPSHIKAEPSIAQFENTTGPEREYQHFDFPLTFIKSELNMAPPRMSPSGAESKFRTGNGEQIVSIRSVQKVLRLTDTARLRFE